MTKAISTMPASPQIAGTLRGVAQSKTPPGQFGGLVDTADKALRFDEKLSDRPTNGSVRDGDADGNMPRLARTLAESVFGAGQTPRRQMPDGMKEEAPSPDDGTVTANDGSTEQMPEPSLTDGQVPVPQQAPTSGQPVQQSGARNGETQQPGSAAHALSAPDARSGEPVSTKAVPAVNAALQDEGTALKGRIGHSASEHPDMLSRSMRVAAESEVIAPPDRKMEAAYTTGRQTFATGGAAGSVPLPPIPNAPLVAPVAAPVTVALSPAGQSVMDAVQSNSSWSGLLKDPVTTTQHVTKADGAVLQTLRVQLHPAELGVVRLKLRVVQDRISVDVQVDTVAAGSTLARDADVMASAMRALGFRVDGITVSGGQAEDGLQNQFQNETTDQGAEYGSDASAEDGAGGGSGGWQAGVRSGEGEADDAGNHRRSGLYI